MIAARQNRRAPAGHRLAVWAARLACQLAIVLLTAYLGLLVWTVFPRIGGWQPRVVESGSMAPAVRTGDVVIGGPIGPGALRPGRIVMVSDPAHRGSLLVHRVVAVEPDGALRTRGDANSQPDSASVRPDQVRALVDLRIPAIGLPVVWSKAHRWLPLTGSGAIVALAVVGAAWWVGTGRGNEHRRRRDRLRAGRRTAEVVITVVAVAFGSLAGMARATFVSSTGNGGMTFTMAPLDFSTVVRADNPAFYYRLTESNPAGTTAGDSSQSGTSTGTYAANSGQVMTAYPTDTASPITGDMARSFATGQWLAADATSPALTGTLSADFWMNVGGGSNGTVLAVSSANSAAGAAPQFAIGTTSGNLTVTLSYNNVSGQSSSNTSGTLYPGLSVSAGWHYVALTTSPTSTLAVTLDTTTISMANTYGAWTSAAGYWKVFGTDVGQATGSIDEVAVYPTALPANRVTAHQAATGSAAVYTAAVLADSPSLYWRLTTTPGPVNGISATDSSGAGHTATYYLSIPGDRSIVLGRIGPMAGGSGPSYAIEMNTWYGRSVYFQDPGGARTTFSMEAWFKTTGGAKGTIFGFSDTTVGITARADRIVYLDSSGHLVFGTGANGSRYVLTTTGTYNDDAWHLVTATLTPSHKALYVDGSLAVQTTVAAECVPESGYTPGYWHLGGMDMTIPWPNMANQSELAGQFAEWSLYPTELSAARVLAHWNARTA